MSQETVSGEDLMPDSNATPAATPQHTPGPWSTYQADDDGDTYVGGPGDVIVCQNATDEDALLIAAAPEMLAALQRCNSMFNSMKIMRPLDSQRQAVQDMARAAIAKAVQS